MSKEPSEREFTQADIDRRAADLFVDQLRESARRTDRMFAVLMLCQWLAGIAAALWLSPRVWAGSRGEIQQHVYAAIYLGGLFALLPVLFALHRPGRGPTRHVIAVGQMLTSALLVHLAGGRIETHFHIFGSLAILAFYRDWRVLLTASVVVAIDHFVRGWLWPQSIYGVLAASPWRALEHLGWVTFVDVFLFVSIRRSLQATRAMVAGRAELEASRGSIEQQVRARTQELRASELRFRSLCESSPLGIYQTDAAGHGVYTNPGWTAISGLSREESVGVGWRRAVVPEDRAGTYAAWAQVASGREFSHDYRVRTPDGVERWVHSRAAPLVDEDGALTGYVGTVVDITERKLAETEMLRAREAALEAARFKSEFVANMSHEIRTPMTCIIGMSELALETDLNPEQRESLLIVKNSADSLLTLLNDILDFSRIEAGKLSLEPAPFSLRECVGGALKSLALRSDQKGLELAYQVHPDTPDWLVGDAGRLRQVLINLVGNAIKFTERGEVVVMVEADPQGEDSVALRFSVRDTGIGIDPANLELIFQPFTQADGSMTRRYGGTGLGLAICTQLVELMGGTIRAASEPGRGSAFTFTVALERATQVPALLPLTPSIAGRRVLVVDDNAAQRSSLSSLIERWGAVVHTADSGRQALATLERTAAAGEPFDVVLLDAKMPDLDGLEVARLIREEAKLDVRILLLTSPVRSLDAARGRSLGLSGHLTKPVTSAELLDAIVAALAPEPARDSPPPVRRLVGERRRAYHVLLAEDNPAIRLMIQRVLEKHGHSVVAVEDGRLALAARESMRFDVIVMDVQMPVLDGLAATARIREQELGTGEHVPVLALTAHAMQGDRERFLEHGMDAYLSKPVRPRELLDALHALLDRVEPERPEDEVRRDARPESGVVSRDDAVFDHEQSLLGVDGDEHLLREVVRNCLADLPQMAEELGAALEARDAEALERLAHRARGGLAMIGATASSRAAAKLEMAAGAGDLEAARSEVGHVLYELERLMPVLESLPEAA